MRILIVDDEPTTLLVLESALQELGHDCLAAADGLEAWSLLQTAAVDAIISDWVMPGMDGIELCRRLREQRRAEYTYFIFLTSNSERQQALAGIEAGADDYLLKPLDLDELRVRLLAAARTTTLRAQLAAERQELETMNRELAEQGRTDSLTQLGNRLRLEEDLQEIGSRMQRYGQRYCVAMCDIDFFKTYNDTKGHLAGDAVLRSVANAIRQNTRRGDSVYRYGGEEFLLILPDQTLTSAALAVEHVRRAVEALAIELDPGPPARLITISAGIAPLAAGDRTGVTRSLEQADAALYRAKKAGRNNVQVTQPPLPGAATTMTGTHVQRAPGPSLDGRRH
jgi:two-component system chemotaxis response regulator CheY